jgi:hypothetical protein
MASCKACARWKSEITHGQGAVQAAAHKLAGKPSLANQQRVERAKMILREYQRQAELHASECRVVS